MSDRLRTVGFDLLLFAGVAAAMLLELSLSEEQGVRVTTSSLAAVLLASTPVLLRRSRPVLALVLGIATVYVVMAIADIHETVPFPSMIAAYSVALTGTRGRTVLAGLLLVPPVVLALAVFGDQSLTATELLPELALVGAPLMLGSAVRERRAHLRSLLERAEQAERTREEEARRRVGEERLRIARDVHDVVAHAMVAINIQAGVGAHLLDRDLEQARRTFDDIKRVSGDALTDLRSAIGTLRSDDEAGAPNRPVQRLDELHDLRASLRSAGVEVDLDVDPATGTVPAAVSATGYRIVQEALTNVVRHAAGSHARVRVARDDGNVVLDISDDGPGGAPGAPGPTAPPGGTGNGVRGMRERVHAAGGTFEAGPRADGGWRVLATLPLHSPTS